MENIHPIIQKLNISARTKVYFNRLELYEIIEDPIILCDEANNIDECLSNRWSFKVELEYCNSEDIKRFYQAVRASRKNIF